MSLRQLKSRAIGRFELLQWINKFLEMDYAKVEDLADGIAYIQVLDALYPGKVPLHLVNFTAAVRPDFERNLNLFQRVLKLCKIKKEISTRKLANGVFQEHLELLQWIYAHVHKVCPDVIHTYAAYDRRKCTKEGDNNPNLYPTLTMRPGDIKSSSAASPAAAIHPPPPPVVANNADMKTRTQDEGTTIPAQLQASFRQTQHASRLVDELRSLMTDNKEEPAATKRTELALDLSEVLMSELRGRIQDHENLQFDTFGVTRQRDRLLAKLQQLQDYIKSQRHNPTLARLNQIILEKPVDF